MEKMMFKKIVLILLPLLIWPAAANAVMVTTAETACSRAGDELPASAYSPTALPNAQQCAAVCIAYRNRGANSCVAYSYDTPSRMCRLERRIRNHPTCDATTTGVVSGVVVDVAYGFADTNYSGQNYNNPFTDPNSASREESWNPVACQNSCILDRNGQFQRTGPCAAWTFVRPGVRRQAGVCWLKSSVPAPTHSDCCVSGQRAPD